MLKNCLKIKVPSADGWSIARIELDDGWVPVTGYDEKVCQAGDVRFPLAESLKFPMTVTDCFKDFEVIWQGDSWPE